MQNVISVPPGIFIRLALLGQYGVNNLHPDQILYEPLKQILTGMVGWSRDIVKIHLPKTHCKLTPASAIWADILKIHEDDLQLGAPLAECLYNLTFINAYQSLLSENPVEVRSAIVIYNFVVQHLIYFEQALHYPMNWQGTH